MAVVLPFITKPKSPEKHPVGNEEIGILEFPKLKDLSVNERKWIRETLEEMGAPDIKQEAVKLARAIASSDPDSGLTLVDVYDALVSGQNSLLGNHLDRVIEFQDLINKSAEMRSLVYATAMIKFRLLPEWTIEDSGDADKMQPELLGAVATFAFKEESNWYEPPADEAVEAEKTTEEELGKSKEGNTSQNQTGQMSIGESPDSGEAKTKGSRQKTLEISQSA